MVITLLIINGQGQALGSQEVVDTVLFVLFSVTTAVYQSVLLFVINAYLLAFTKLAKNVGRNGIATTDLKEFETLIDVYQSLNFGLGKERSTF